MTLEEINKKIAELEKEKKTIKDKEKKEKEKAKEARRKEVKDAYLKYEEIEDKLYKEYVSKRNEAYSKYKILETTYIKDYGDDYEMKVDINNLDFLNLLLTDIK